MILVTGITGSGKSTTLAAMIDFMNRNRNDHIVTIEDPIEFVHEDKKCVISQREIGHDSATFAQALRAALREDPDIILVGEMRDAETMEVALHAAETGHLVLSTLHTLNAAETVNRIISTFPPHQEDQIRDQLAAVMQGIVSQRLVVRADGKGRVPAVEVMLATGLIRDCIRESEKTPQIPTVIAAGQAQYGMQTFDQSLLELYREELITYETARDAATNPDDFDLKVKGIFSTGEMTWDTGEQRGARARRRRPAPCAGRPRAATSESGDAAAPALPRPRGFGAAARPQGDAPRRPSICSRRRRGAAASCSAASSAAGRPAEVAARRRRRPRRSRLPRRREPSPGGGPRRAARAGGSAASGSDRSSSPRASRTRWPPRPSPPRSRRPRSSTGRSRRAGGGCPRSPAHAVDGCPRGSPTICCAAAIRRR